MTAPTSYMPLVDQQLSLFNLVRPTERVQSTLETLKRLALGSATVGEIERARALETLLDMYLRDSILLQCVNTPVAAVGLSRLFWNAPSPHSTALAVIAHVGAKLTDAPERETQWWGALHSGATFTDPTLSSLQQMALTFTNDRIRSVFEGTAESIIEDVQTLEFEWEETFSELVSHLGIPSDSENR